ncbi:putative short chain dehydrogenase/oxidoreductase [Planoprotostelium fungivorum]|uniref:Putative short chain dehydrogenase/oxidoreductase n=1 Tax=Planoprotostelium fungivorum TaxID=1890364 RepID=A0A2P6N911_9EUKA|nr:putative short chain dehydrogenase/oxidoreductase [Planoprotostelium fungivorum]
MSGLMDKVVIVTGGGGGLGLVIARQFLQAGSKVVVCDINREALDEARKELRAHGTVRTLIADVSVAQQVEELLVFAIEQFGRLDVLVNNAAILDRFNPVGRCDTEIWDRVMAVNLTGPFLCSSAAVRQWEKQGSNGVIVNIGSVAGQAGHRAGAAYTASKHGLVGLTKNTATSYYGKHRCNIITPGGLNTNLLTPLGNDIDIVGHQIVKNTMTNLCSVEDVAKVNRDTMLDAKVYS